MPPHSNSFQFSRTSCNVNIHHSSWRLTLKCRQSSVLLYRCKCFNSTHYTHDNNFKFKCSLLSNPYFQIFQIYLLHTHLQWVIVLSVLVGLNWWMKPLNKWHSYRNSSGILPSPPTTCAERLAACLCKTQREKTESDKEELAKEALAKAHQNPALDTPPTSQSSLESSYSSSSLPLTLRKMEDENKRKDSTLEVDDNEL